MIQTQYQIQRTAKAIEIDLVFVDKNILPEIGKLMMMSIRDNRRQKA